MLSSTFLGTSCSVWCELVEMLSSNSSAEAPYLPAVKQNNLGLGIPLAHLKTERPFPFFFFCVSQKVV